jgi:outer membrane protein assembly factor BamA
MRRWRRTLATTRAMRFARQSRSALTSKVGSQTLTARIRNVFGGAELFEANFSSGTRTKFNYSAKLESPLFADPDWRGQLQAYAAERDLSLWASCREESTGASVGLSVCLLVPTSCACLTKADRQYRLAASTNSTTTLSHGGYTSSRRMLLCRALLDARWC